MSEQEATKTEQPRRLGRGNRRLRNFFIGGVDQLQYGILFAAISLVGYVATVLAFIFIHVSPEYELCAREGSGFCQILQFRTVLQNSDTIHIDVLVLVALGLFNVGVYFFLGVMVSHRTFGPIFKVEKMLQQLVDGDYEMEFKLRRHDHLEGVADKINKLAKRLRDR